MSLTTKKIIAIVAAVLCVAAIAVSATVALLTSLAGPVDNTFTIGNVKISLTETTGASYDLIPGSVIAKDPKVTVEGGSEDCWLFIKVSKTEYFDDYLEYAIADGWTHLGGYDGVYYRSVVKSASGNEYYILKDNAITVSSGLTEEKMSALTAAPKITFNAYAVQRHSIDEPNEAWYEILKEGIE